MSSDAFDPAFPGVFDGGVPFTGMTLRDYFAAHAPECPDSFLWGAQALKGRRAEDAFNRLIEWPYYWADEQMKQREKK